MFMCSELHVEQPGTTGGERQNRRNTFLEPASEAEEEGEGLTALAAIMLVGRMAMKRRKSLNASLTWDLSVAWRV